MPLPTHTFGKEATKFRHGERYVSQSANVKLLGYPYGVYLGFTPTIDGDTLRLSPDATYGISLARSKSTTSNSSVDVVTDQVIGIDFSAHDWGTFPTVNVKVKGASSLGVSSSASVFTDALGPSDTEQLICVLTKPGATIVIDADAPANRSTPFAFAGAPMGYGFMASGATEEIQQAVAMVGEVERARTDLSNVYHDWDPTDVIPPPGAEFGLHDRIVADLLPAAVAGRLGLAYRVIRSNAHTLAADTSDINVSSSLTETARTLAPVVTIDPSGSESQAGAVTDDVEDRNVCFVVFNGTRARPVDGERHVSFGRLSCDEKALTGTLTFGASPTVTGVGTDFTDGTQVERGDIILGADGFYYTVINIIDPNTLTIDQVPAGPGIIVEPNRRRWVLSIGTRSSSGEAPFPLLTGQTIRFFFGAWFDVGASVYDATLEMFEGGEEPPLPSASAGVEGKVQMFPGLTGAKAGAIQNIQVRGAAPGTGLPVYSLGFAGASDAGGGVAFISQAGETGIIGEPGTGTGPPGPAGPAGTGFETFSASTSSNWAFAASGNFTEAVFPFISTPGEIHVFTVAYPGPLKWLHGGLRKWSGSPANTFFDHDDHFDITTLTRDPGDDSIGVIENTRPDLPPQSPTSIISMFLNGAG